MSQGTKTPSLLDEQPDQSSITPRNLPLENLLSALDAVKSTLKDNFDPPQPQISPYTSPNEGKTALAKTAVEIQFSGGREACRSIHLSTELPIMLVWQDMVWVERFSLEPFHPKDRGITVWVQTGPIWDHCSQEHRVQIVIQQVFERDREIPQSDSESSSPDFHFRDCLEGDRGYFHRLRKVVVDCCVKRQEPQDFADLAFLIINYQEEVKMALLLGAVSGADILEAFYHDQMGREADRNQLAEILGFGMTDWH